jgi:uncharacterized membrane-anchored protein
MEIADQISQQVNDALAAAPLLLQRLIVGLLVFAVGYLLTRLAQYLIVRAVRRTPGGVTVEHALSRVIIAGIAVFPDGARDDGRRSKLIAALA